LECCLRGMLGGGNSSLLRYSVVGVGSREFKQGILLRKYALFFVNGSLTG